MNIRTTALTISLLAISALPAVADFSDPGFEGGEAGIELSADETVLPDKLGRLLDEHNQPGMSEPILARHLRAAHPAGAPQSLRGHGGGPIPHLVGDNDLESYNDRHPVNNGAIQLVAGTMALQAAAGSLTHAIGTGYVTSAAPQVVASGGSSISVTGSTPKAPVPLPPAALLFASGLLGFPLSRRLRNSRQR